MELKITINGLPHGIGPIVNTVLHAALSGVALALAGVTFMPHDFNLHDLQHLGKLAAGGAILGIVGLLRKSPLTGVEPPK